MKKRVGIIVDECFKTDIRVKNEVIILCSLDYEVFVLDQSYDSAKKDVVDTEHGAQVFHFYLDRRLKSFLKLVMNSSNHYETIWAKKIKEFINKV